LKNDQIIGKPDIVLSGSKTAIFVNGCFWHGHDTCQKGLRRPTRNAKYWTEKIRRNKVRDALVITKLKEDGWQVVTIWECNLLEDDFEIKLNQSLSSGHQSRP
jgi:DNA mismatch endonuclease (patch repair protein)